MKPQSVWSKSHEYIEIFCEAHANWIIKTELRMKPFVIKDVMMEILVLNELSFSLFSKSGLFLLAYSLFKLDKLRVNILPTNIIDLMFSLSLLRQTTAALSTCCNSHRSAKSSYLLHSLLINLFSSCVAPSDRVGFSQLCCHFKEAFQII